MVKNNLLPVYGPSDGILRTYFQLFHSILAFYHLKMIALKNTVYQMLFFRIELLFLSQPALPKA